LRQGEGSSRPDGDHVPLSFEGEFPAHEVGDIEALGELDYVDDAVVSALVLGLRLAG